jgi:hypothetical protein
MKFDAQQPTPATDITKQSSMQSKQKLLKMLALLQSWHSSAYLQIFAQKVALHACLILT